MRDTNYSGPTIGTYNIQHTTVRQVHSVCIVSEIKSSFLEIAHADIVCADKWKGTLNLCKIHAVVPLSSIGLKTNSVKVQIFAKQQILLRLYTNKS